MPHLKKSVPSYRKHKPSGRAVVTLGGRDHYVGRYGTVESKVEYERLIAQWLASGRMHSNPGALELEITVAEIMAQYLRRHVKHHYVKNGQPTSEQAGIRCALKLVRRLYGHSVATKFGPLALKTVRERMIEAGLARGTINQNVGRIRRMFKWAASEELIPNAVQAALYSVGGLQKGRSKARETAAVGPVADGDIEEILPQVRPAVAAMVRLQRLTGMRPGEVVAMRPRDIDRSGDLWVFVPESHKTEHHGSDRKVFVGPKAQAVLKPFLSGGPDLYCFRPGCRESDSDSDAPVARPNMRRRPTEKYSVDSYRVAVQRACRKVGIAAWSPNQLRHTRATEIRSRFNIEAAQVTLGHSRADVTEIYAERDFSLARRVALESG